MKNKLTYIFVNTDGDIHSDYSGLMRETNKKAAWCKQKLNNLGIFPVYWVSVELNWYGFSTDMCISDELKCILYLNGVKVKENCAVSERVSHEL